MEVSVHLLSVTPNSKIPPGPRRVGWPSGSEPLHTKAPGGNGGQGSPWMSRNTGSLGKLVLGHSSGHAWQSPAWFLVPRDRLKLRGPATSPYLTGYPATPPPQHCHCRGVTACRLPSQPPQTALLCQQTPDAVYCCVPGTQRYIINVERRKERMVESLAGGFWVWFLAYPLTCSEASSKPTNHSKTSLFEWSGNRCLSWREDVLV